MTVQLFAGVGSAEDVQRPAPFSEIYIPVGCSADRQEGARKLAAALCQKWGCSYLIRQGDEAGD